MPRQSLLVFAALLLVHGIGRADWHDVQSVEPGAPILVKAGFESDAGKFVSATDDAVVVETHSGEITVSRDEIDQVFVYRSRAERAKRGVLWAGVGAGVTAAVMFPAAAGLTHALVQPNYALAGALTGFNGWAIGAGTYYRSSTKRIYQRKR
jgi:hypothetical protein